MAYAMRVRLYSAGALEADTDPDLPEGAPGSEIVATLAESQRVLVALCRAAHGEHIRLLGFGEEAMHAYGAMLRSRAGSDRPISYRQGYTALLDTPELRQADAWVAQVDIVVSR